MSSTYWTTIGRLVPFRLAPGEFVEVIAAGIGVGANKDSEDWQGTRVGSWVEAKAGDDVTLTTKPVPASDWNEAPPLEGIDGWWPAFIVERLGRELPLPAAADERTRLLDRVMRELFGAARCEEIAAFTADGSPAARFVGQALQKSSRPDPVHRQRGTGPTIFRVLPDPEPRKKPRT